MDTDSDCADSDDVSNAGIVAPGIRDGVANTDTVVPSIRHESAYTRLIISEARYDLGDRIIVSDVHRNTKHCNDNGQNKRRALPILCQLPSGCLSQLRFTQGQRSPPASNQPFNNRHPMYLKIRWGLVLILPRVQYGLSWPMPAFSRADARGCGRGMSLGVLLSLCSLDLPLSSHPLHWLALKPYLHDLRGGVLSSARSEVDFTALSLCMQLRDRFHLRSYYGLIRVVHRALSFLHGPSAHTLPTCRHKFHVPVVPTGHHSVASP